jgi:DNA-binding FadR family transcriptional regulator
MDEQAKALGEGAAIDGRSMVVRTVRRLVDLSLAADDGAYLGSEGDLIQLLGISRPTLRQAAKVVESDQLLSVRRGVNGGFYAIRPDARHVVQSPALWLRLQHATLDQMSEASQLILPEAAASATRCTDPALIEELRTFRDAIDQHFSETDSQSQTIRWETDLARLVARMSGNPVLALFIDIAYAFGLLERDIQLYRTSGDRRKAWRDMQREFCDAILAGDADQARAIGIERGRLVGGWIRAEAARLNR